MSDVEHDAGIPAYGKIHALGSRFVKDIMNGTVYLQEKVDGSQFSFGVLQGRLRIRSKGREIFQDAPDALFRLGVEYVQGIQHRLVDGWIYRGEYLCKPKHNALCYARIPHNHIALFDVLTGREEYAQPGDLTHIAEDLGIEAVPLLGKLTETLTPEEFLAWMSTESFLGGQTIEGMVIKNYGMFCEQTGHVLMAKYVSEAFKEVHAQSWKQSNPTTADIVQQIIDMYKTPARWEKAVYRLRDSGEIEDSPKDIGKILRSVWPDIEAESEGEIKDILYKHFSKQICRGVSAGLPEWYKLRLVHQQFEEG